MKKIILFTFFLGLMVLVIPEASAAPGINKQIPYQGTLKTSSGIKVTDGDYDMVFKIYNASTNGTTLWTGTHTAANGNAVTVTDGVFSVLLGSGTGNAMSLDFNDDTYYLGVKIGSDSEMTPRKRVGASGYAFNTDTLDGIDSLSFLRSDEPDTIASSSASTILTITQSGTGDILNLFDGSTEVFTVLDGGNVGIGTTTPATALHVIGDITASGALTISGSSALQGLTFTNATGTSLSLSGLTQGSALFAGANGVILEDNANFFWDDTNNRLGIGTTNPGQALSIDGNLEFIGAQTISTTAGALTLAPTTDTILADGTGLIIGHTAQISTFSVAAELQVLGTGGADTRINLGRWTPDASLPVFQFIKSRNATIGSNTIVQDNDPLGAIFWIADDGVDFETNAAEFIVEVDDASPAESDIGAAYVWKQRPGGGGALAETMRLTATGNLGLGTSTPSANLVINGTTGQNLFQIATSTNQNILVVDANGQLGIGTANPGAALEVVGDITSKGTKWTLRTTPIDKDWDEVIYGNGLFVAVGSSGTGNRVMTSSDGINWATTTSATDKNWRGITYGNGLFVAVASGGTAGNRVMTSPDGINWTSRTTPIDNNWTNVTYGNGLFVAVATTGTNRVMTSPDGITWTTTSAPSRAWVAVTYGNGLFVAVSLSGVVNQVMTSPDGLTWTLRSEPTGGSWRAVTYGNGLFVAVGDLGTGTRVMTSPDGITWTIRTSPADNTWYSVTYGNGLFVAVSLDGSGNRVMTSPDGITWTSRTSAADNGWLSVTYGNGVFVAVSNTGADNQVMTSGKSESNPVPHDNILQGGLSIFGNVGIGDTTPASLFTVGSGDLFQVNSSGAIAAATGITSSGTIAFSGLSTNGVVYTSGGTGTLNSEAQLAIARGGTNKALTLSTGGIPYFDADSFEVLVAGTTGQLLTSGGTGAPTWTSQGSGNGLDADTLDSIDSLSFLRSDASDAFTSGTLTFNDSTILGIGTGNDLQITHNGTNSVLTSATGNLLIDNTNATGATQIQLGTDTSATDFQVLNNTGTTLFEVDGAGDATLAGGNFLQTPTTPVLAGGVTNATLLNGVRGIDVDGHYAYVAGTASPFPFAIIDISNSASPTIVGSVSTGLFQPVYVAVSGDYAVISEDLKLTVIDVSNPTSPFITGSVAANPDNLMFSGRYVYATNISGFSVYDIADPANPTLVGSLVDGTNLASARGFDIEGNYAYVVARTSDNLEVIDISDPTAPVSVGRLTDATNLNEPFGIDVVGRYAYIVARANDSLEIVDVSNPTAPVRVGGIVDATNLADSRSIKVVGDYAYIPSNSNSSLEVFDISDPTAPVRVTGLVDATNFLGAYEIKVQGNNAYVTAETSDRINVVNIGGTKTFAAEIGSLRATRLNVTDKAIFGGGIFARSLNLDSGGFISGGDSSINGKLDVLDASLSTTAATTEGLDFTISDTGIVTTGTDTLTGLDFNITRTGATGGTINTIGLDLDVVGDTGGTSTLTGLTVDVSGADTNYAALFSGGNVGIGTSTPDNALTLVGSTVSDAFDFSITSNDALIKLGENQQGPHGIYFGNDGGVAAQIMYHTGSNLLSFEVGTTTAAGLDTTDYLTIDFDTGNVGIGTTAPAKGLHILGDTVDGGTQRITGVGNSAKLELYRANGTITSQTAVISGNSIGSLRFGGLSSGTSFDDGVRIFTNATENWSASGFGSQLLFSLARNGVTTRTTRFSINGDGKLHSRTTNLDATDTADKPQYALTVHEENGGNGLETGIGFSIFVSANLGETDAPGAAITHERTGSWSAGKLHFKTRSDTTQSGNPVTRMTIDENGRVGIGTTTPAGTLHVANASSSNALVVAASGNVGIGTASPSNHLTIVDTTGADGPTIAAQRTDTVVSAGDNIGKFIVLGGEVDPTTKVAEISVTADASWTNASSPTRMEFHTTDVGSTEDTEKMRIDPNGNVGIGETNPAYRLEVGGGDVNTTGGGYRDAGSCVAGTCASDITLKQNIQPIGRSLEGILQLTPSTFEFIDAQYGATTTNYGLIAQEVEPIFPEWVVVRDDGYKSIRYGLNIQMRMLKAIQEVDEKIQGLIIGNELQGNIQGNISVTDLAVTNASFEGNIIVKGHITLGQDTVGKAKILIGDKEVRVLFEKEYESEPIITLTVLNQIHDDLDYIAKDIDVTGFTIEVDQIYLNDIDFSWHVFGRQGTKIYVSDGSALPLTTGGMVENTGITVAENPEQGVENPNDQIVTENSVPNDSMPNEESLAEDGPPLTEESQAEEVPTEEASIEPVEEESFGSAQSEQNEEGLAESGSPRTEELVNGAESDSNDEPIEEGNPEPEIVPDPRLQPQPQTLSEDSELGE